jgi:hypothetical protein
LSKIAELKRAPALAIRKRCDDCDDRTFRRGPAGGLMPAHEQSIRPARKLASKQDAAIDVLVGVRNDVVTGGGRRRRWSSADKARIVSHARRSHSPPPWPRRLRLPHLDACIIAARGEHARFFRGASVGSRVPAIASTSPNGQTDS